VYLKGILEMRLKGLLILLLALAMPMLAAADEIDLANSGGTLSGSSSGLSLSGSTLVSIADLDNGSIITGNLGTVSFTTGAIVTGSLAAGGTLAQGGTFTITGNGTNGAPSGVIFAGTFDQPLTWTMIPMTIGPLTYYSYSLNGSATGTAFGQLTGGFIVQLAVTSPTQFFNGATLPVSGGYTSVTVPEGSSIAMLGISFLAIAGGFWKKTALAAVRAG
jgi:hypothetical protein